MYSYLLGTVTPYGGVSHPYKLLQSIKRLVVVFAGLMKYY